MPIIEVEGLAKTFRTRDRAPGLAGSLRSFVAPHYRERAAVLYGPARTLVHFQLDRFGWLLVQQVITLAVGSLVLLGLYWVATRRVNINGG